MFVFTATRIYGKVCIGNALALWADARILQKNGGGTVKGTAAIFLYWSNGKGGGKGGLAAGI